MEDLPQYDSRPNFPNSRTSLHIGVKNYNVLKMDGGLDNLNESHRDVDKLVECFKE